MERKNTMLLTVIAVATLLVAVVGATFAFYSVTGTRTYNNTSINTTTGKIGTVAYASTANTFYLNVRSAQMANTTAAKGTYYSTTNDSDAVKDTATEHTIGTFTLTGADPGAQYKCTFTWGITVTETSTNVLTNLSNDESSIVVGTSGGTFSGINASYYTKAVSTTAIDDSAYVILTAGAANSANEGAATATITAYQTFVNTNSNQNNLAELALTTSIGVTNVSCDTYGA